MYDFGPSVTFNEPKIYVVRIFLCGFFSQNLK
jgi:hypothetical protein